MIKYQEQMRINSELIFLSQKNCVFNFSILIQNKPLNPSNSNSLEILQYTKLYNANFYENLIKNVHWN